MITTLRNTGWDNISRKTAEPFGWIAGHKSKREIENSGAKTRVSNETEALTEAQLWVDGFVFASLILMKFFFQKGVVYKCGICFLEP